MSGPREIRDEDLDRAVEDDRLHEAHYGFSLNSKTHEIYDWDDQLDEDLEDGAMSRMLSKITTGKQAAPLRELVYGIEGVGKTSFGAGAPKPVFLGEDGTKQLDVARFPVVRSWEDVTQAIDELRREKHDYETLVVDTLDHLEPVLWKHVAECGGQASIEDVGGGFGKGYTKALESWNRFALSLEELQAQRNMHVILLAHAQTKKHKDPIEPEYDRFALRINEKAAALFRGWAHSVLFAAYRTTVSKAGRGKVGLVRAATFERILFTQRIPAADAKNRYDLKPEMEFSFRAFWQAVHRPDGERAADKREEAHRLLELVHNEASRTRAQKALEAAGENLDTLRSVISKLIATLEAQDAPQEQAAATSPGAVSGSGKCEPAPVAAAPSLPDVPAGRVDSPPAAQERKPAPAETPVTSVKPGEVRAPAGASAPPPASLAAGMGVPANHELALGADPVPGFRDGDPVLRAGSQEGPQGVSRGPLPAPAGSVPVPAPSPAAPANPNRAVTVEEVLEWIGEDQRAHAEAAVKLLANPKDLTPSEVPCAIARLIKGGPRSMRWDEIERIWKAAGGTIKTSHTTKGKAYPDFAPMTAMAFTDFWYGQIRGLEPALSLVDVMGEAPHGF